jgi:starch synthase (maltosyl-transferring)
VVNFLIKLGFSGFRCDAAYQIPGDFWKRLINETKAKNPDVLFFAETLGCPSDQTRKTAEAGFDYIFNSSKWWDLYSHWLMEQYNLTREIAPSIGFPESHDTVRLCEEFNGNTDGLKQRYLFSALFSAGVMMPIGFEYGFRKKLHVVKTKPDEWEKTDINLTSFIKSVNTIKCKYKVFQNEHPTGMLHNSNPNIMVMWKTSTEANEESILILNKDIHNKQPFYSENLLNFVQTGDYLVDVSPEYPLDYIPSPFHYELRPGQGIVMVTAKKATERNNGVKSRSIYGTPSDY